MLAFCLSLNNPKSLNNVGEGFRALAANTINHFVLAFAYIEHRYLFYFGLQCSELLFEDSELGSASSLEIRETILLLISSLIKSFIES